jgi:hypothetical protein
MRSFAGNWLRWLPASPGLERLVTGLAAILLIGAADAPSKPEALTASFQTGVNGYRGTIDTEIWAVAPDTVVEANPNASTDANNDGGESQVLMRFDEIVGDRRGQVPKGASVLSARLCVSAFDQGDTVNLHRVLVPWKRTSTWNSLGAGISADGLEASRTRDSFTFGKIAANTSEIVFDVTDTVQAWVNGEGNHGWVFINNGGNGWDFYSSEFEDVKQRPRLVIEYRPRAKASKEAGRKS